MEISKILCIAEEVRLETQRPGKARGWVQGVKPERGRGKRSRVF